MAHFNRSFEEAKWFVSTAEDNLVGVMKPNLLFGMAHIFDKKNVRNSQYETVSETIAQIAATFDPNRVEVDEERKSFERSGTISVRAANIGYNSNNPLYDQGLPNVCVRPDGDNSSTVTLQYIEDHKDRGISATPSMHPVVRFAELTDGGFELDLGPWAPRGFEIPLRHQERLTRVVKSIGTRLCSEEFRTELFVIKSL